MFGTLKSEGEYLNGEKKEKVKESNCNVELAKKCI